MNNNINIVPLSNETLKEATKLVNSVFNDEDSNPGKELKASLSERDFLKYQRKVDDEVLSLQYYVATLNTNVIGIIGLYTLEEDYEDTAWLGWYCVSPKARGMGVGVGLLNFAIEISKEMDKKYLSLYTSTDENERVAQLVYEKHGFNITFVENHEGYDILYRTKKL